MTKYKKSDFFGKKIIIFDLDGTLTPSKSALQAGMSLLLAGLLQKCTVAIISGGKYNQFQKQFLGNLKCPSRYLKNLFLFPTNATAAYYYKNGWKLMYKMDLSRKEKAKVFASFKKAMKKINYENSARVYGKVIEDRGGQITFSALGQKAPLAVKEEWNAKHDVRKRLVGALSVYLPDFEVRTGGLTSVDVTRKGIDKAYGIRQIMGHLKVRKAEVLFVGDAIFPGGNDYAAVRTGVRCVRVSGPRETEKVIRTVLEK